MKNASTSQNCQTSLNHLKVKSKVPLFQIHRSYFSPSTNRCSAFLYVFNCTHFTLLHSLHPPLFSSLLPSCIFPLWVPSFLHCDSLPNCPFSSPPSLPILLVSLRTSTCLPAHFNNKTGSLVIILVNYSTTHFSSPHLAMGIVLWPHI